MNNSISGRCNKRREKPKLKQESESENKAEIKL